MARKITAAAGGELEITNFLDLYLKHATLHAEQMGRGSTWLDTGTHGRLLGAGNLVWALQARQGLQVDCPEWIAFQKDWTPARDCLHGPNCFAKRRGEIPLRLGKLRVAQEFSKKIQGALAPPRPRGAHPLRIFWTR